jgi:azurin
MRLSFALLALLAAAAVQAQDNCTIALEGNDAMQFDKQSVTVSSSCETVTISLKHVGKLPEQSMGHNVVVSPTAVFQAVAQEGMKAGPQDNYVPAGDERVIGSTEVIGGGESTTATFPGNKLKAGEAYTFYCSFPGHWAIMKGELIVQ